jgi:ADP-heptose:LPS heptosyltransferase
MKVLFASLSRIGDYIQHMQIVQAWSLAHPSAEVHVLVNDLIPTDLMRMNSQFTHIVFPRFEYQKRINQVSTPLIYPFLSLRKIIKRLQTERYDQLIDLSLQAQSATFLKLINPGFAYSQQEIAAVNDYLKKDEEIHLIDKIKRAHGLALKPKAAISTGTNRILFQVTTSDLKKNIDLPRWKPLIEKMRSDFSSKEIFVVGASQERSLLQEVFKKSELLICGFTQLSHLLDSKTKLISLDTSIKHFAALFQTPIVEISVGSSHWIKNAAYQTGNYIFSADFHCRPCVHSVKCPLGRNQCQDSINFDELQTFVSEWVENGQPDVYPAQTETLNGNLSIQRGEKWNQRTRQTNLYL